MEMFSIRPKKLIEKRQTEESDIYFGTNFLLELEQGLVGYNKDIVRKIVKGLSQRGSHRSGSNLLASTPVLEFGAGTGTLAEIFKSEFDIIPDCIEIDPTLVGILKKKGFHCFDSVENIEMKYQWIYTSNVLEHIEDDVSALNSMRIALAETGKIAIYVPALQFLYSDLDSSVGHFRRYGKKELISKVISAGFIVETCFYNDSIGVFASMCLKILGFKQKNGLGSAKSLKFYDRYVYPISKAFDTLGLRYIMGKNILLIAKK